MKTITLSVNMVDNSVEATDNAPRRANFVVSAVQKDVPETHDEMVNQTPRRIPLYDGPSYAEAEAALIEGQNAMAKN